MSWSSAYQLCPRTHLYLPDVQGSRLHPTDDDRPRGTLLDHPYYSSDSARLPTTMTFHNECQNEPPRRRPEHRADSRPRPRRTAQEQDRELRENHAPTNWYRGPVRHAMSTHVLAKGQEGIGQGNQSRREAREAGGSESRSRRADQERNSPPHVRRTAEQGEGSSQWSRRPIHGSD